MRGRLILIEGLDRSGKSTQASILTAKLANGKLIKFPDRTTNIGKIINQYLTDETFELSDQSAHLLFSSNRWELAQCIVDDLHKGINIVMDRYIYSGIAYSLAKSYTTKCPQMGDVDWLYSPDKGLPKPDVTFFLTLDLEQLSSRKGWGDERYEKQEFQKTVKQCFLKVLQPDTDDSIQIVDVNNLNIEEVTAKLWTIIEKRTLHKATDEEIKYLS